MSLAEALLWFVIISIVWMENNMDFELKPGDILQEVGKPRTYRVVEKIDATYVYTRKPNRTPHRIPLWQITQGRWEKLN